jgi:hypothetical protein
MNCVKKHGLIKRIRIDLDQAGLLYTWRAPGFNLEAGVLTGNAARLVGGECDLELRPAT